VDRIASLRALLIVTFRPEFEPPWIGQPHVTALTINRLAERDIGAMIDSLSVRAPAFWASRINGRLEERRTSCSDRWALRGSRTPHGRF
jgi:hypothetical protein